MLKRMESRRIELFRLLSANGRAGRLEWLLQSLGTLIAFGLVMDSFSTGGVPLVVAIPAAVVLAILGGWMMWSVTFRRLHDLGKSAADAVKILVPGLNIIWICSVAGEPGDPRDNSYGPPARLFEIRRPSL
jgi:uncharacterized membrane protein YhaH (DUF805 family)